MAPTSKKIANHLLSFICDQYLVLFFIITIGAKMAWFNGNVIKMVWPTQQYLCGVLFGFLGLAILFAPLFFVKKRKNLGAIILASVICLLMLVDHVYYSYFSALPTVGILSNLSEASGVGSSIATLLDWPLLLYILDIILVSIFHKPINSFFQKLKKKYNLPKISFKTPLIFVGVILLYFGILVANMGGNSISKIIDKGYDPSSASQFYGLVIAHGIDIARFAIQENTKLSVEKQEVIAKWVTENKPTQATTSTDLSGVAKGKNIILLQVESLAGWAINQKVKGQEITPNLNKLVNSANYYPNDKFIIGGGHTSDTDFVANTSYFPFDDAAVFVRFGRDDFTSLPKNLIANSYSTYVYHGFNRNFWNRNTALKSLGYQKFYAADNYPDGTKINMGLDDETFLTKTAEYIKNQPKPSLSYVITLTSHVPFQIPSNKRGLDINTNDYPYLVGDYFEAINYTDRAIGKFFDKLQSEGLYDDSLIVVYGDHIPVLPSFTIDSFSYDSTSSQNTEVPLFIKTPQQTTGATATKTGSNLDIMPTVLDLAGVSTDNLMFGHSLISDSSNSFTICANQIDVFGKNSNCKSTLQTEKSKSEDIIRYNLFNKISK